MAVLILILANGFFVAAEFALVAVDRSRVETLVDQGHRRAVLVQDLLRHLAFHLSGAQLGITLTSLIVGILVRPTVAVVLAPIVEPFAGEAAVLGVSIAIAIGLATVLQMVIGELVPKSLAIAAPETTAFRLAPAVRIYGIVFGPLIRLLDNAANATVRRLGVEPTEELSEVRTLSELQVLVHASSEGGTLDAQASTLLSRSIRFETKTAEDVLVPRTAISALAAEDPVTDLVALSMATGHSRFLVHGGDLDEVLGVVHVSSVHAVPRSERSATSVGTLMRPVLAVPESRGLDDVLVDLRRARTHLAVVVDEYGGTAGIVTVEDVLEEIVGEIADEHDPSPVTQVPFHRVGEWEIDGTLHPDEVMEQTGLVVPDGEYETVAGFVLSRLGHLPVVGETVTEKGWRLTVLAMDRRRVARLRLQAPIPERDPERTTGKTAGTHADGTHVDGRGERR